AVETKSTTGSPYAAESVTETVQVLADGNRINRRSVTKIYRDGEGRTRREMLADDGSARNISISDPVAHTSFTLDPKTKIAYQAGGNIISPMRTPAGTVTPDGPVSDTADVPTTKADGERSAVTSAAQAGGGGGRGGVLMRTAAPDDPNVRKEDLGLQNIEGVMATGTRTTTTIPAGQIGNPQEIRIVSEQWFSDELQVLVMTKHSDPAPARTPTGCAPSCARNPTRHCSLCRATTRCNSEAFVRSSFSGSGLWAFGSC
ncbi:MAG: hypothetical protein H0W08_04895, partial [Acidobacteria bacterium]|nr:hypothetical protein [Acidobacteriota bacterium]